MVSSVLRSTTAVHVNIEIMRAFVRLRRAAVVSRELMALNQENRNVPIFLPHLRHS